MRGFFLYALEIIKNGKNIKVFKTNLDPLFWKQVGNVIRQNKKTALIKFLFPAPKLEVSNNSEDQIEKIKNFDLLLESLQDEINSLKNRIAFLEGNHSRNLNLEKDLKVGSLGILSEAPKTPLKAFPESEQYNVSLDPNTAQNEPNFITLGNISEDEKIEIIKKGFQLNQEGKISFKNYYQGTQEYSLFQFKGYNIKYDTIRKNKLYLRLKP